MPHCSCGNPAVGRIKDGPFVCMPCLNEYQRNLNQAQLSNMAMMNYLGEEMAWLAGLSGTAPTIRIPQPNYLTGPVNMNTTNNIRVEAGSQVGQINAGAINLIDRT